ncbi:LysM peptidoglycan-binding domain-containing protein [Treponema sp. R80B11-R83G3]
MSIFKVFHPQARKRSGGKFLIFLFCTVNLAWAQTEERPMRGKLPDPTLPFPSAASSYVFTPAENSLITDTALEQPLTQRYIEQYSSPHGINTLNAVLGRGSLYLPFIKEEVARRNMPPELAYLPVVESGFIITARSKSGAMGLWQFMLNSISPYKIRVTDFIDERRDFEKSTIAALQKLDENYRTLGSWELALAAYNSGLGAINKVVKKTGRHDYWELINNGDLKKETLHYVPKLIAANYIISQPRKYGINVWHEKVDWTAITLKRQISIDILANETGVSKELLRSLNAELLYGISPAESDYRLKVPTAYLEKITDALESEDLQLLRYHYHIVRQGDTIWSMSRYYGTSVHIIEQHNPGISNRLLKIGETIVIPAFGNTPPPKSTPVTVPSNLPGTHVVQKGETFWSLSRKYGVDPQALAEANGLKLNDILHEGRTIRVPIIE